MNFNIYDPKMDRIKSVNKLEQFVTKHGGSYEDFISSLIHRKDTLDIKVSELHGFTLVVPYKGNLVIRNNESGSIRKLDVSTLKLVLKALGHHDIWQEIYDSLINK